MKFPFIRKFSRWQFVGALSLMLLPPVFLVVLLAHYGVNAPFWDQWELVHLIQKLHQGTLNLADLYSQHNEHRILFPRLIMLGLAEATHWNTAVEPFVNVTLALGSAALLISMLWKSLVHHLGRSVVTILSGLVIWLMFSPVQWENWLWGWQIQWFLSILGSVATIYFIAHQPRQWPRWSGLLSAGVAATIATYSLANGMFVWFIALAMLIIYREPARRWLAWAASSALVIGSYYINYVNPPYHPSKTLFLHHPKAFIEYVLVYLGRPLGADFHMVMVVGAAILGLFLVSSGYLIVRRRQQLNNTLPWLAVAAYAGVGAVTTAISRLGLGIEQAFSSRYTTVSSLFTISTLVIATLALKAYFEDNRQTKGSPLAIWLLLLLPGGIGLLEFLRSGLTPYSSISLLTLFFLLAAGVVIVSLALGHRLSWLLEPISRYRIVLGLFLVSVMLLVLANYADGTKLLRQQHNHLLKVQHCLHQAQNASDPCLTVPYPNAQVLWPLLQYLRSIHYGGL
jgi:hypothetical protein